MADSKQELREKLGVQEEDLKVKLLKTRKGEK